MSLSRIGSYGHIGVAKSTARIGKSGKSGSGKSTKAASTTTTTPPPMSHQSAMSLSMPSGSFGRQCRWGRRLPTATTTSREASRPCSTAKPSMRGTDPRYTTDRGGGDGTGTHTLMRRCTARCTTPPTVIASACPAPSRRTAPAGRPSVRRPAHPIWRDWRDWRRAAGRGGRRSPRHR